MTNLLYKIDRLRYESVEIEPPELMNSHQVSNDSINSSLLRYLSTKNIFR